MVDSGGDGPSAVVALGVSAPRAAMVAARQADDDCMDDPLGPVPAYSVVTHGDFERDATQSPTGAWSSAATRG